MTEASAESALAGDDARVAALQAYGILDTPPEAAFDDFTVLASRLLGTPVALLSLIDHARQWFKSRVGLSVAETPRAWALCETAIRERAYLEVPDTLQDPRFADHPVVRAGPQIRFYAGCPLITPDGHAIGTLCVLDHEPRRLDDGQRDTLARLARQVMHLLELRRLERLHQASLEELRRQHEELQTLSLVAQRTNNLVVTMDPQGRVTWANEAFTRISGYPLAEVLGRRPGDLLHYGGTGRAARQALAHAVSHRQVARVQVRQRTKDGRVCWLDLDLQPLAGEDGRFLGFVAVATDITELVRQREHQDALIEAIPVGVLLQDRQARIVRANARAEEILGVPAGSLLGREALATTWQAIDDQGRPLPDAQRPVTQVLRSGRPSAETLVGIRAADRPNRWLRVKAAPLPAPDGGLEGVVTAFSDVSEELQNHRWLNLAVLAAGLGPWTWDLSSGSLRLAPAWSARFGGSTELTGWDAFVHPDDLAPSRANLQAHWANPTTPFRNELRLREADGQWRWVLCSGAVTDRGPDGSVLRMAGVMLDIDERKRAESALAHAAATDALTGLPNRNRLADRLSVALAAARRHGHHGALLFLDLDQFKRVNDTHGHGVGDALLRGVAQRLQAQLRVEDTLARMGGDELMVLLPHLVGGAEQATALAQAVAGKLQQALGSPIEVDQRRFRIGASIGCTIFPKTADEGPDDLIREADTAMYGAKAHARGSVRHFERSMQESVARRLAVEVELQSAVDGNQLQLHLQGKYRPDGRLAGAEALLRWRHPQRGMVMPGDFIAVAEDSGLIVPIGGWVLGEACRALRAMRRHDPGLTVAVNVSPRQFRDPEFGADLRRIVAQGGVPPEALILEITEGTLIHDSSAGLLAELAREGFRFSIDDFGTEYSSLAYLKRLPVHELKIDRTFVHDLVMDHEGASLVSAILSIARQFRIGSVAEGVETQAQADFLSKHGCDLLQGYLFGRPTPWPDFLAALTAR